MVYQTVEFSISSKITKNEYLAATFGAFAMFMGAYFLVITGWDTKKTWRNLSN